MKQFIKRIRKIFFISMFTLQSIVFVCLLQEYFNAPFPNIQKEEEVQEKEIVLLEEKRIQSQRRKNGHVKSIEVALSEDRKEKSEKDSIQNIYLETDFENLETDPFKEAVKDLYIYQLPKDNIAYMKKLFMRGDVCEQKWLIEVDEFTSVLDKQNVYWLYQGDQEVQAFAQLQENLSTSLKAMSNELTPLHIDIVKRCYKDYEAYYFAKFNWGNDV